MADKLKVLEEFLKTSVWFIEFDVPVRLTGLTIKVEPTGYFVVLKAITAEGPKVAFIGVRQLDSLRRVLLGQVDHKPIKWRQDRFALDENL